MTQSNQPTLILPDKTIVAVTDEVKEAGVITWWSLAGTVNYGQLKTAWEAAGLSNSMLPSLPSPAVALSRTMKAYADRRTLVRKLHSGDFAGGYVVMREIENEGILEYYGLVRARLNKVGQLEVRQERVQVGFDLQKEYNINLQALTTNDVSVWLANLSGSINGVALRAGGGIYFIPYTTTNTWNGVFSVLTQVSDNYIYRVPALQTANAVEAILAAVAAEADATAKALEEELDKDTLGVRALRSRAEKAEAMRKKLASYEELLGRSAETVAARLEDLQANLAMAALAAEAD